MREIKFRGLSEKGEMVYGFLTKDLPNSTLYYNEYSYRIHWETECGKGTVNCPVKNGTVGQFTGMQDKNGVEIYEGDILSPEIFLRTGYYKFPVIFRDGRFMLSGKLAGFDTLHKSLLHSKKAKNEYVVIGNIYENPELISDERRTIT